MANASLPPRPPSPSDSDGRPISRDAILLPGFDADVQLDEIDFSTPMFKAAFFTKMYTNEQYSSTVPASRLRNVRYGNNVTLLFRVCYFCSDFYRHPDFWTVIARGFSTRPNMVQDLADTLVYARNAYLDRRRSSVRSPLITAVDYWITFIEGRGRHMDSFRADDLLLAKALQYFADAKTPRFLQNNSGAIPVQRSYETRTDVPLKRPRSPSLRDSSPDAKRRLASDRFDRRDDLPLTTSTSASKESIANGQGTQPCENMASSKDSSRKDRDRSDSATIVSETFENLKIRGRAELQSSSSVPLASTPVIKSHTDQDAAISIKGQSATSSAPPTQDGRAEDMERKFALLEKRLEIMENQSIQQATLPTDAHAVILKLQMRVTELESQQKKDREVSQIALAALWDTLSAAGIGSGTATPKPAEPVQTEHMEKLKSRVEHLELRTTELSASAKGKKELQDALAKIETLDVRLAAPEGKVANEALAAMQVHRLRETVTQLQDDLKQLPEGLDAERTERAASFNKLWDTIVDVQERIDVAELELTLAQKTYGSEIQPLAKRIDTLEQRLDVSATSAPEGRKELATKGHLLHIEKLPEERLKRLERELAENKSTINEHLNTIKTLQKVADQTSSLVKSLEKQQMAKSPPPTHDYLRGMEDMQSKINNGLATASVVMDKMNQLETDLRALLRELEQKVDGRFQPIIADLETAQVQIKRMPLPEKWTQIEQSQRDTTAHLAAFSEQVDTAKMQIKGLDKLLNETTAEMAKQSTVKAVEDGLASLNQRVGTLSRREASASELERRVGQLSIQVRQVLGGTEVSTKLQELGAVVEALRQSTDQSRNDTLTLTTDLASLHDHVYVIASRFTELVNQFAS